MQEIISFLNQGWIGILAGGALGLFLHWRSRIPGIIAFQSRNVSLIGGRHAVLPADIKVLYRETAVPGLAASTVWLWNAGNKTVRRMDIVASDPLRFSFDGEVLNVRIRKVSRESVQIKADILEEGGDTVRFGFEFLDPGDGGVLDVLHSGSAEAPECNGTIIGLPKAQDWGSASSKRGRRRDWVLLTFVFISGLALSVRGILGREYLHEILPFVAEPSEPHPPYRILALIGLFMLLFSAPRMWTLQRRPPSLLDVD